MLPRNFHLTFKPERQYIRELLRFAAAGESGDYQYISKYTGIPMGESSGKVPAIFDYCRGMGLIKYYIQQRSKIKTPELTDFGRTVFRDDPFLKLEVTQWIAHFNLCNPITGAEIWNYTFQRILKNLGNKIQREELDHQLNLILGINNKNSIGPMVGMYEDQAAFFNCGVLSEKDGYILRKIAPIKDELVRGYGAWISQLIMDNFPDNLQVTINELEVKSGWRSISGWTNPNSLRILELIEKKGIVRIDRQMSPWIIQANATIDQNWKNIYLDYI